MRRRLSAPTAALAVIAVAASALAACSDEPETSPDGVITLFAPQWPDQPLDDNAFTKHIEAKFDVDLQFETTTYDAGPAAEKRQISLASGDYPDAYMLVPWVTQFSRDEIETLGSQGVIVPLQDLVAEHAPNITAAFEKVPEYEQRAYNSEGVLWGLPQWNDCFHCQYSSKLWMNQAWLDTLGLVQPTTPEELRTVLEAFKTQDPNGNGQADEIPLSGAVGNPILPYLMSPFAYSGGFDTTGATPASLALDGDQVVLQPTTDGWREGLTYIRELWEDGLVDDGAFTQNGEAFGVKTDNPDAVIVGATTGQQPASNMDLEDGRNFQYQAVPPLTGPDGDNVSWAGGGPLSASFVITNRASEAKQQKLIEIMDYIYTYEGHLLGEFGEEGVNWARPEAGDVPLDETMPPLFKTLTAPEGQGVNTAWGAMTQYFSDAEFRGGQIVPTDVNTREGYERRLFEATLPYSEADTSKAFPYWEVSVTGDQAQELSTVQTNLETFLSQANAEFITGIRDIRDDAAWQSFQDEINGFGAEQYTAIYQTAWDEVK
ncbi:ABC transporter substrate-binding protein [Glycomyces sp. NPDC048151]|uniref:ABC transporter substrate-binding protein n=1 Tax=Glycomyces sp. NPDC048151 TaxID=3364002 RepID=UPI0037249DA1